MAYWPHLLLLVFILVLWFLDHRFPKAVDRAEENMLMQSNIVGYKTLTELGNALGGQSQKDVNELVKSITDSETAMKNTLCKKGK